MMKVKLLIHTALLEEARIFIEEYKLKKLLNIKKANFYYNPKSEILITISGIGASNTSFTIGYAAAYFSFSNSCIFLNYGLAGHNSYELGSLHHIHAVTNSIEQKTIHLPYAINKSETKEIITYHNPVTEYPNQELVDLESYYFVQNVQRLTSKEFIFCIKIISDNKTNSFDKNKALSFLLKNKDNILNIANQLQKYSKKYYCEIDEEINDLLNEYHLTKSEYDRTQNYLKALSNMQYNLKQLKHQNKYDLMDQIEKAYFNLEVTY